MQPRGSPVSVSGSDRGSTLAPAARYAERRSRIFLNGVEGKWTVEPRGAAASVSRSDRGSTLAPAARGGVPAPAARGRSLDPDRPVYLLAQDITARARADFAQRQHGSSRGMRVTRRQATLTTAKEWLEELGIYSRRHERAIQECPRGWSVEIELPAVRGQEGPSRWEEELFHGTWLSNVPSILKRWRRKQGRGLAVECGSRQGVDEDEGAVYVSNRFETACGYPMTAW